MSAYDCCPSVFALQAAHADKQMRRWQVALLRERAQDAKDRIEHRHLTHALFEVRPLSPGVITHWRVSLLTHPTPHLPRSQLRRSLASASQVPRRAMARMGVAPREPDPRRAAAAAAAARAKKKQQKQKLPWAATSSASGARSALASFAAASSGLAPPELGGASLEEIASPSKPRGSPTRSSASRSRFAPTPPRMSSSSRSRPMRNTPYGPVHQGSSISSSELGLGDDDEALARLEGEHSTVQHELADLLELVQMIQQQES